MRFLIKIFLIVIIGFASIKFLPIGDVLWGYSNQEEAKSTISTFYRFYNYGSYKRIYDNVLDSHTRLLLSESKFSHILNKLKIEKGRFIAPVSKKAFHYQPFIKAKNFIFDFFQYRDKNIVQNSFYVFKKNGRRFYIVNFHAKFQRGFAPSNFVLVDTIDGLKVITPIKMKYLKEYF